MKNNYNENRFVEICHLVIQIKSLTLIENTSNLK